MTKKILELISPLPPSVNSYLNYRVANSRGKRFVQVYPSRETEVYNSFFEDYVRDQIREQKWIKPEKGKLVTVLCTFYLDRKRKDPNNFLKVMLDVLSKAGVYVDDDIALPVVDRLYIDSSNPRIEIKIFEHEAIGFFDNKKHLERFIEKNCVKCNKNREKCSYLKRALDNRIIDEFKDEQCLKIKK